MNYTLPPPLQLLVFHAAVEIARRRKHPVDLSALMHQFLLEGCGSILTTSPRHLHRTAQEILEARKLFPAGADDLKIMRILARLSHPVLERESYIGAISNTRAKVYVSFPSSLTLALDDRQAIESASTFMQRSNPWRLPPPFPRIVDALLCEGADAILAGQDRPGVHGQKPTRAGARVKAGATLPKLA